MGWVMSVELESRLARMMEHLAADPGNRPLARDIANTAYEGGHFECLDALIALTQGCGEMDVQLLHTLGLSQLRRGQLHEALATLAKAASLEDHPVITYNLAHAYALNRDYVGALQFLDDALCGRLEQAVSLRLTCLHHLQRIPEMLSVAERHPTPVSAMGVLAAARFDQGDEAGAVALAKQASETAEGATVLGLVALSERRTEEAMGHFGHALTTKPNSARALLGLGLAHFSQQQFDLATTHLDSAAHLFRSHAGSWLAAGWAQLLAGDKDCARARFQTALEVDRGFAEALGALAVVDAVEQRAAQAETLAQKALRLDPLCHSALLPRTLIADGLGDLAEAQRMFAEFVSRPLADDVPSIAELLRPASPARRSYLRPV